MRIDIFDTNLSSHNRSILVDLGKYFDVNTWLEAIVDKKSAFKPVLCGIKFNNEWFYVVSAGHVKPDAAEIVNNIRKLPINIRKMPNDTMKIQANATDGSLYINLDGDDD